MTTAQAEAAQPQTHTASAATPILASTLPQVAPSTYLLSYLTSSTHVRPNARQPSETRSISLNTGSLTNTNGSALVRLGNTSVVCGVRAEILDIRDIANYRPRGLHGIPTDGVDVGDEDEDDDDEDDSEIRTHSLLVPNIELQTGASPLPPYQPSSGAPSSLAQSLAQRLLSILHSSRLVRPSDLRIYGTDVNSNYHDPAISIDTTPDESSSQNGSKVLKGYWTLYIDMLLLSHDGSVFDAAFMSLVAALRNTILPKAWFDFDRERIVCSPKVEEAHPLRFRGTSPVSLSWKVFVDDESSSSSHGDENSAKVEDGSPRRTRNWILLDPDAFEEDSGACREGGCMVVDRTRPTTSSKKNGIVKAREADFQILKLEKNGGPIVSGEHLEEILSTAAARWKQWDMLLKQEDAKED